MEPTLCERHLLWNSYSIRYNSLLSRVSSTHPTFLAPLRQVSESLNDLLHLHFPRNVHYICGKPITGLFNHYTFRAKSIVCNWEFVAPLFVDLETFFNNLISDFSHAFSLTLQIAVFKHLKQLIKKILRKIHSYHTSATIIQKAFRGFHSRKSVCLHNPHSDLGRLFLLRLFPST